MPSPFMMYIVVMLVKRHLFRVMLAITGCRLFLVRMTLWLGVVLLFGIVRLVVILIMVVSSLSAGMRFAAAALMVLLRARF